jgi:hypothetical protein
MRENNHMIKQSLREQRQARHRAGGEPLLRGGLLAASQSSMRANESGRQEIPLQSREWRPALPSLAAR